MKKFKKYLDVSQILSINFFYPIMASFCNLQIVDFICLTGLPYKLRYSKCASAMNKGRAPSRVTRFDISESHFRDLHSRQISKVP